MNGFHGMPNRFWWALWRRSEGLGGCERGAMQSIVRGTSLDRRGDGRGRHVRNDLHILGPHVQRLAGRARRGICMELAQQFIDKLGFLESCLAPTYITSNHCRYYLCMHIIHIKASPREDICVWHLDLSKGTASRTRAASKLPHPPRAAPKQARSTIYSPS